MVCVLSSGPPPVITSIWANRPNACMVMTISTSTAVLRKPGHPAGWQGWGPLGQTRLRKRARFGKIFPDEGRIWLCKLPQQISQRALAQPQGSPTAPPGLGFVSRAGAGSRGPDTRRAAGQLRGDGLMDCTLVPQGVTGLLVGNLIQ